MASVHNPHKHTITKIPDRLWDETSTVLSREKPDNAVGRPIVPFRKVMGGIMHILRTGSRKTLSREHGSGSTCHRQFQEWVHLDIFRKTWARALALYDDKEGIRWTWQSLDSIPIKSPLGGMTENSPIDRSKLGTKRHILTDKKRHAAFGCHSTSQHS